MNKSIIVSICAISIFFASCEKEKALEKVPLGDCVEISYQYNIRPIIENSCKSPAGPGTGCHAGWIDDYTKIKKTIGDLRWPNEIFLYKTMPVMPNIWGIDSLSESDLEMMQCWIDQGYPEN